MRRFCISMLLVTLTSCTVHYHQGTPAPSAPPPQVATPPPASRASLLPDAECEVVHQLYMNLGVVRDKGISQQVALGYAHDGIPTALYQKAVEVVYEVPQASPSHLGLVAYQACLHNKA